ncbi:two-component system OmpR family sensor kinase [Arthrobacter sp. CAN_A6]|uniref:sensor histidine kinase n=1 Tax=Arthrobacter sp. CAN_A6 TaxID=2787721 RepID=UPI0018C9FB5D
MSSYFTGELDNALGAAAGRAGLGPGAPPGRGNRQGGDFDLGNTQGQRPGTLNALFTDGQPQDSAVVQDDGDTQALTEDDLQILSLLDPAAAPVERTLSSGTYRLDASEGPGPEQSGTVLVTGFPTAEQDRTLLSLDITGTGLSLAGLTVTGLAGTVIIRRSLRPLEQLSAVATSVSRLPLASGEVEIPVRVPPAAARPGTEGGTVGIALNEMINHVTGALRERHASETKVRQFVADASHELRTPLTSIRGYTELIFLSEQVSPSGRSALERVDSESKRMSSLVEDLLLLARLDEGQREGPADVDLSELIVETMSDAQVSAPDHQWKLELPDEPVVVPAVGAELRQVMINLLSNAHQRTPPGTEVATALRIADGSARITVTDDGPGIDPGFLGTIFTRFSRGDAARTSRSGSTGLGLAIVQALVTANSGTISVSSKPGETRFVDDLPTARSGPAPGHRKKG